MENHEHVDDAAEQEQEPAVVPNRRERRGHAQKTSGVNATQGRPVQSGFAGRRVFRRKAG
ncbi:hypothetical protein ACFFSW_09825 [Saccharothrix longispora]|uniref:Uncharacterized protein n=1 Tax=Saccharothrix longispora TaxID=33920 RepID=A0ABU1Q7S4_9PSEU|nr:hypothetical protein [Saccharothrix longispora]MDR6598943.1 hypothetical protein [Saccharothrix longispora]